MIGMTSKVIDETHKVKAAVDRSVYKNIRHAAFSIRKTAGKSIIRSPKPSKPGRPPHTRGKKKGIRRALRVGMEGKYSAVIGTQYSVLGDAGEPLEHGGKRGKSYFEPRPFIGPALEANLDRFAKGFGGSLG